MFGLRYAVGAAKRVGCEVMPKVLIVVMNDDDPDDILHKIVIPNAVVNINNGRTILEILAKNPDSRVKIEVTKEKMKVRVGRSWYESLEE